MFSSGPIPEDIPTDVDALLRIGTVAFVDLVAGRCVVSIGDEISGAIQTPPIKWNVARAGQMTVWAPPIVGEQVIVAAPGGELAAAVIIGSLSSNDHPNAGSSAENIILFDDGALLSYDSAAQILNITLPGGGAVIINAGGTLSINASDGVSIMGDIAITGNVTVTGTLTANDDVIGGGKSLKDHRHSGVQLGGAVSGPPS